MPIPRPRFTVRRLMVAVAVAALIAAIGSRLWQVSSSMYDHNAILIASSVAGVTGLWAMRSPLISLGVSVIFCLLLPATTYELHVYNLSFDGCILGWIIGAPVGWFTKQFRAPGPARSEQPNT